jgi:glutathione S-transferase
MAASADLEVFGKAVPFTGQPSARRGDCPFSQRTYLDLEEKKLQYKGTFVQEGENDSKPDWFMKNNPSGLMPVLRDGDQWIQDSDKIFEHLESKFPEPSLKPSDSAKQVGQDIFPKFMGWLQEKNPNASDKKGEFEAELKSFEEHIKSKGPYIDGEKVTDADLSVAPKLLHARVALKYWYGYEFPAELTAVRDYQHRMEERPSFKNTRPTDDLIIQGWGMKIGLQSTPAASGP